MNKREYKKAIETLGSTLCLEIFQIGTITLNADAAKIEDAMNMIWNAMVKAKHSANHYFGKKVRDFENRAEYNRARHAFYKDLFSRLSNEFETVTAEALKLVNEAVPENK